KVPDIHARSEQLKQLLGIFLSNAKKAMALGGQLLLQTAEVKLPAGEAPFSSGPQVPHVMLAISDSGNGMQEETQSRILQLFSGRWQPRGGIFAGLQRAKEILDEHHARLLFYSQMIRGTTFKMYFPLKQAEAAPHLASLPVSKGTETLLFVEDEPMMRH